mmetsp:Transcript_14996/g.32632  ORF Transcript_14996/g.32632 Transcript_14996/m.32632 type:complete len:1011 (-) Transcript_14996:176-3208(-)|eukprot:CAMPEP_0168731956 /NCGR_PEP_ID=MMETSP0724-20121128/7527_1 /TAXON_ID=265536 /ORGANISM="Amphiprora sp., Strain CCMP467" /LENGTH=1010 /DNA_ID=CAMNT_0008778969 /DNA_START=174 /DNA_END=3206 /DNA_ORIENTATION=+
MTTEPEEGVVSPPDKRVETTEDQSDSKSSSEEMKDNNPSGSVIPQQNESREDISFGNARDTSNSERDEAPQVPSHKGKTTSSSSSSSSQGGAAGRKAKKPQSEHQPSHHHQQQGHYYPNMQPPQGAFPGSMPRGMAYGGLPYPYPNGNGAFPPPPYHHPHHMQHMPHFNGGGGPPYNANGNGNNGNGPYGNHYGNHPYQGGAMGPNSYPPHGMPPSYPSSMHTSDSASISSKGSKSSKKRTIDGVHESSHVGYASSSDAYAFRRSNSNSSTTSTVTVGNNTSIETHGTSEDSHHGDDRNSNRSKGFEESDNNYSESREGRPMRTRYHRRDYSADGSTTSTLSGGFSMASYDRAEDAMATDSHPIRKMSPKRMKNNDGEPLVVDTHMRPASVASNDADHSTRFEQLSIGVKEEPTTTKSEGSEDSRNKMLFLTLSTSPINAGADVDATPISKNTLKQQAQEESAAKTSSIFKKKGDSAPLAKLEVSTSDVVRSSVSPNPSRELGDSDMTDDHNTLNRHLRGQSFTPVNHLSNGTTEPSSSLVDSHFGNIAPQLSWSIAGDTPSLSDLAEWDEGSKSKPSASQHDLKLGPASSRDSADSRNNMSISPHDFHLFTKESDHELMERAMDGATTPLPAFFESRGNDGSENHTSYESRSKSKQHHGEDTRPSFVGSSNRSSRPERIHGSGGRPMSSHRNWSKHDHGMSHGMHPTPMYHTSGEYRDDGYPPMVRSPYGGDRRDQIDASGGGAFPFFGHPGMHSNERIRNLRGRMPPNAHYPPMLQIPHHMSAQLPMTSPMALPNKAGLWSPHGGLPPLSSPHHLTSPMNSMSQTKRKCVPLKPPIPSKFQGDPEKVKNTPVPEFTSLVNFPTHMSQKQAINLPEGMRCCVMCGQACPCSNGGKNKNKKKNGEGGGLAQRNNNGQDMMGDKSSGYAQIPTQNKGLCTLCDVNVWVVVASGLEIKWCKGCKNFRPWAAFGDKGLATKCLRCRERQREKYALQKEEKEKARNNAAMKAKS